MSLQRGGLALGVIALVAAVAAGSRVLGVVGVGFLLAGALTWLWARLADGAVSLSQIVAPTPAIEGDRVRLAIEIRRRARVPVGSVTARVGIGRLGARAYRMRGHGRVAKGEIDLGRLPRGVFPLSETEVVFGDLLGLVSVTPRVSCEPASIVVRPRLVALDGLFSDAGRAAGDGRRILLRRAAGFDFHSVREYEQGESLRRVHWPTSARRAKLMVKELEDTAHDGVVVVLDCDPRWQVGEPPDSSLDVAVRVAGSLIQAHVTRGRIATFVSTGRERAVVPVRSAVGDLEGVLSTLAAVEANARDGLARFLSGDHPWTSSGEIAVVTASGDPTAFAHVLALSARRSVSVVWIDAASFASRPTRAEPGLLRLAVHGIPTAVVRRGDDLATVLSARSLQAVGRG
ncbi:MAG TPA: DUF58 domain-containing protein [Gaiellaceae bacterium]|nr:DUF58 domain-containing protein [Gaiellaceae bacterium]